MAEMADDTLAAAVAAGARLSVYLEPDQDFLKASNGQDDYIETYPLPFVFLSEGKVWGATRPLHLYAAPERGIVQPIGFAYTDAGPVYSLFSYDDTNAAFQTKLLQAKFLAASHYRTLEFLRRPAGERLWSSAERGSYAPLRDSIRDGNGHYIVFTDADGRTAQLPLDLAFYYPGQDGFELRVEFTLVPKALTIPQAFFKQCREQIPDFDREALKQTFGFETKALTHSPYACIRSDGTYRTAEAMPEGPTKTWRHLEIFRVP